MQFPPLTDLVALLGIDLVLCATGLRLLGALRRPKRWSMWAAGFLFAVMWIPVGAAHLPVVASIRGISSDLSTTLVALACLALYQRFFEVPPLSRREMLALSLAIVFAASCLYPMALGWGNWDPYRAGWGSWGMLAALLAVSGAFWFGGLRLLPMIVALALLAWSAGLMESTNLWDYLMDPWLSLGALLHVLRSGLQSLVHRRRLLPP